MPRFYFDTDDGQTAMTDVYGIKLADRGAACDVAVKTLPDLALSALPMNEGQRRLAVSVRDAAGQAVLTATLCLSVEWA